MSFFHRKINHDLNPDAPPFAGQINYEQGNIPLNLAVPEQEIQNQPVEPAAINTQRQNVLPLIFSVS